MAVPSTLSLSLLDTHVQKQLIALETLKSASKIEPWELETWFKRTILQDSPEVSFLNQLNRDNQVVEATKSLQKLVGIYQQLHRFNISSFLEAYIIVHDLAKPLCPERHDKLISAIMNDYDESYGLWERFHVKNENVKRLFNLALRHHHIFGVMIIGELSYLIFEELFTDEDFLSLDKEIKELLFSLLILHSALDAATIEIGYLNRTKLNRYFQVKAHVNAVARNTGEQFQEISEHTCEQRIAWLISSHDHLLDSRPIDYYHAMLPADWQSTLNFGSFKKGMAKVRRIVYGAKFLYALVHQVDNPTQYHHLQQPVPGAEAFLHFLMRLAELANAYDNIMEVHFKNLPFARDQMRNAILYLKNNSKIDMLFDKASKKIIDRIHIIEINCEDIGKND